MFRVKESVTITKLDSHYEVIFDTCINDDSSNILTEHVVEFNYDTDKECITVLPKKYNNIDYVSDLVARDIILHPGFRKCLCKVISEDGTPNSSFMYERIKPNGKYEGILNDLLH